MEAANPSAQGISRVLIFVAGANTGALKHSSPGHTGTTTCLSRYQSTDAKQNSLLVFKMVSILPPFPTPLFSVVTSLFWRTGARSFPVEADARGDPPELARSHSQ